MKYKGWTVNAGDGFEAYYVDTIEHEDPREVYQIKAHAEMMCRYANDSGYHPGLPKHQWTPRLRIFTEVIKIRMDRGLIV